MPNLDNWNRLATPFRVKALAHLRTSMLAWPSVCDRWRAQVEAGQEIGSDDPNFHFGAGMAVRNILRQAVPDHKLPMVKQPFGNLESNWDDYYQGALYALMRPVATSGRGCTGSCMSRGCNCNVEQPDVVKDWRADPPFKWPVFEQYCTRPDHRCGQEGAGPCNGLPRPVIVIENEAFLRRLGAAASLLIAWAAFGGAAVCIGWAVGSALSRWSGP